LTHSENYVFVQRTPWFKPLKIDMFETRLILSCYKQMLTTKLKQRTLQKYTKTFD